MFMKNLPKQTPLCAVHRKKTMCIMLIKYPLHQIIFYI